MPQRYRGPDGRQFEFPDEATPLQIKRKLRSEYGMRDNTIYESAPGTEAPERGREIEQLARRANAPEWVSNLARRGDAAFETTSQGLTFGFSDELAGLTGGPEERERSRELLESARETYPGQSVATEVSGGLMTAPVIPGGSTLRGAMTIGAGAGGVYGAGAAEGGVGERAAGATGGALLGAGAGAAGNLIPRGIGLVIQGIRRANTPADARALEMIVKRLDKDGMTPRDIQSVVNRLRANGGNLEEALVDVTGQNVRSLGRAVANTPGPGREMARTRLIERARGANFESVASDDLGGAARRVTERGYRTLTGSRNVPSGGDFQEMVRGVNTQAARTARPLYEQAVRTPFPRAAFDDSFMPLFTDDAVGPIWRRTARRALLRVRGQAGGSTQRALRALSKGEAPAQRDLNVGVLHRLRMAVNDEIGTASRAGEKDLAASLIAFRDEFMDPWIGSQGAAGQAYHVARQTVRSGHEVTRALEDGQKIFTTPEASFYSRVADMSEPERQAYALGALREIARRAGRTENGRDAIKVILDREMRARIRAVWPKDARGRDTPARALFRRLRRERTMQETFNEMLTGSRTTPLAEDIADATFREESTVGSVLDAIDEVLKGASPSKPFRDALSRGFNRLRRPGIYEPEVNKAVTERLFAPLSDQTARDLETAAGRRAIDQNVGRGAGRVGALVASEEERRRLAN